MPKMEWIITAVRVFTAGSKQQRTLLLQRYKEHVLIHSAKQDGNIHQNR